MTTMVILVAGLLLLASLPYWLPSVVLALRVRIFTRINGDEGLVIPGKLVDASRFKQLYSSPAADGRSRGAALSDLFWYWLSPGPEIHQEHIEPGPRYEEIARTTRRILSIPKKEAQELATRCADWVLSNLEIGRAKLVRLRDLMMPIWAEFYYELVFGETCPAVARDLIVENADDVVTALKCCSLRHMDRRHRLTQFLSRKIQLGELPHALPDFLSTEEKALYLQGAFFNTAVVQTSEAMAHLLMVIAQHSQVQARLVAHSESGRYLDHVIDETLRLYPLFGISHRITSATITLEEKVIIPKGTVLCFNHPEYHRFGFDNADTFDPDRWEKLSWHEASYVPFGVAANRPCPASGIAPITMREAAREVLKRFALYSTASHTRSIPNRGPCLLVHRLGANSPWLRRSLLLFLRLRDRWEDVWRSIVQLILGTYMVWEARRLRLCERYFETQDPPAQAPKAGSPVLANHCPHFLAQERK